MPLCDLCGTETKLVVAEIEKARLRVCPNCASYGTVLQDAPQEPTPEPLPEPEPEPLPQGPEEVIDDNYARLVKAARERAGLTQEQLAKAIAEKENVIHRIETKQQEPPLKVAKKLEQYLKIKLVVEEEPTKISSLKDVDFSETNLTIGDLLKMKENIKES